MRVVDESLPAHGGAGLLKIDAHHDVQIRSEFGDGGPKQRSVFARCLCVMNRAGADQNQKARIAEPEDSRDVEASIENRGDRGFRDGEFFLEKYRGQDHFGPLNSNIFDGFRHGSFLAIEHSEEKFRKVGNALVLLRIYQPLLAENGPRGFWFISPLCQRRVLRLASALGQYWNSSA